MREKGSQFGKWNCKVYAANNFQTYSEIMEKKNAKNELISNAFLFCFAISPCYCDLNCVGFLEIKRLHHVCGLLLTIPAVSKSMNALGFNKKVITSLHQLTNFSKFYLRCVLVY